MKGPKTDEGSKVRPRLRAGPSEIKAEVEGSVERCVEGSLHS